MTNTIKILVQNQNVVNRFIGIIAGKYKESLEAWTMSGLDKGVFIVKCFYEATGSPKKDVFDLVFGKGSFDQYPAEDIALLS